MSEEETQTKIEETPTTSQQDFKEPITKKDPKRVEQGKRLALISKQAKEKKMRERIEAEMAEEEERRKKKSWLPKMSFSPYTLGGLSLFLIVYAYHFGLPFKKKDEEEIIMTKKKKVVSPPKSPEKPKRFFEAFDQSKNSLDPLKNFHINL